MRSTLRQFSKLFYHFFAQHLPSSSAPWSFGSRWIRNRAVRGFAPGVHPTANIERGAEISASNISVGAHSGIGIRCHVQGPTTIGADVMMGPECRIYTAGHANKDVTRPMRLQGTEKAQPVVIEDDVWLGARVMVMPGTVIGRGSIVAAGAVVTKDVDPFTVVAGVPARLVRRR